MVYSAKAYAKINLYLNVLGKRDDGYHEIDTLMQSGSLYDDVLVVPDGFESERIEDLKKYIKELDEMYCEVNEPLEEKLPEYYEFIEHEFRPTEDRSIVEGKIYYIKKS